MPLPTLEAKSQGMLMLPACRTALTLASSFPGLRSHGWNSGVGDFNSLYHSSGKVRSYCFDSAHSLLFVRVPVH